MQRFDVFLTPQAEKAFPARAPQASLWLPGALKDMEVGGAGPVKHPLALYGVRSQGAIRQGKSLVDPERTAAYEVRRAHATRPPCGLAVRARALDLL